MSKIVCKKRKLLNFDDRYVKELGYSLIDGMEGEITDQNGEKPQMKFCGDYCDYAMVGCTDRTRFGNHIDIFAKVANIVYDLEKETKVEAIVLRSFYHYLDINYTIGEFKLYASNSREELFCDENEIAYECGVKDWYFGERNNAEWVYDVEGCFRYFGIKILNPNPTDDIARLGYIGLYNTDYTEKKTYINENYHDSLIANLEPTALTDSEMFIDEKAYKLEGKQAFKFTLSEPRVLNKMWVVAKGDIEVSAKGFKLIEVKDIPYGRKQYNLVCIKKAPQAKVSVTLNGNTLIDSIGVDSNSYAFKVDTKDVICNDFMGIGANALPMSFMPENLESGYNDVYWALERERIIKAKPNVVRMWFQPDWLVDNYEDYKNGNYDFTTKKMQSVYKYLDAFLEAGTEIEFNYGWKVSSYAQDWFSFPEAMRRNSAPKELDLFAKCCGELLNELINNRGYNNIKYLTFYNEPDYALNAPDKGDFCVIGCDRKVYWERMMRLCREELDKKGLTYIKMWGCETSGSVETQSDWMNYFKNVDVLDCFTTHKYMYEDGVNVDYAEYIKEAVKHKPIIITECGQCYDIDQYHWNRSHVEFFCDMANLGVSGMLIWCINGVFITDPCSFMMRNGIDMWDTPQMPGGIENVREVYYEWAMLSHYIPNHSKSVKAKVTAGSSSARVSAFTNGDDCTVVVELKGGTDNKTLEIGFDKAINKKFYKHVYKRPCCRNGNAILPPVCAEINVNDKLCDTLTGDYQEVVYTTIPPVPQVKVPASEIYLSKDEGMLLTAEIIDGSGEIGYEMAEAIGKAFTLNESTGYIKLSEKAKKSDMCAVKVYSKKDPRSNTVVIFKVK